MALYLSVELTKRTPTTVFSAIFAHWVNGNTLENIIRLILPTSTGDE